MFSISFKKQKQKTKSVNLLYRLEHGLLDGLYPDICWILIGANDLVDDLCNVDSIVASNIELVTRIKLLRPQTIIVINSQLPMIPTSIFGTYIYEINSRLQCYAAMTDNVEFFNATSIFQYTNGTLRKENLLFDTDDDHEYEKEEEEQEQEEGKDKDNEEGNDNDNKVGANIKICHPNTNGSKLWGEAIVDTVLNLLKS